MDNQPARYYKKPEHIKPGTKKDARGQKTRVKTTGLKRTRSYTESSSAHKKYQKKKTAETGQKFSKRGMLNAAR